MNGTSTFYLWDGDQLLAEYDNSGNRTVRYAYAGGFAPMQVAYGSASESIYDVHSDHLDTPRMLTASGGLPVWRAAYEAFGKAYVSTDPDGSGVTPDPGITFNVRFPGQYYDSESGLHDNRHRVYDPAIGRYVSADPIGQNDAVNVYEYGGNNPANVVDPLGLFWFPPTAPPPVVIHPAVVPFLVGYGIGTALQDATFIQTAIDYWFGDPLASPDCPQAGKRRPPHEPNKPGRKKQGREPLEKKRQGGDWKPRNPPKEPPKHTPSRKN